MTDNLTFEGLMSSFLGIFSVAPEALFTGFDYIRDGKLYDNTRNEYLPGKTLAQTYILTFVATKAYFGDGDSLCQKLFGEVQGVDQESIRAISPTELSELIDDGQATQIL